MNKFLFSLLLSLISFGIAGCSDEDDVEIIDLNLLAGNGRLSRKLLKETAFTI